ncbi:hypothetical protein [Nocardia pseudovaccinii]|uniref:hypothetical protein n=1 Tax=Nocardia pseudovaccinii TaxID=189540 RepID=UPI0007A4B050|nr:hypothetical protein [Nocardia pseudovaccinii]
MTGSDRAGSLPEDERKPLQCNGFRVELCPEEFDHYVRGLASIRARDPVFIGTADVTSVAAAHLIVVCAEIVLSLAGSAEKRRGLYSVQALPGVFVVAGQRSMRSAARLDNSFL